MSDNLKPKWVVTQMDAGVRRQAKIIAAQKDMHLRDVWTMLLEAYQVKS